MHQRGTQRLCGQLLCAGAPLTISRICFPLALSIRQGVFILEVSTDSNPPMAASCVNAKLLGGLCVCVCCVSAAAMFEGNADEKEGV